MVEFSRPQIPYVNVPRANDRRYQIIETRRENLKAEALEGDINYLIDAANTIVTMLNNVVAGSIPGTDDLENKDKVLSTDGEGNIGFVLVDAQNIAERAIQEKHHGDASVSNRILQNGIVTGDKTADRTFPTRVYMDESVTGDKIAKKTVDYSHLRAGTGRGDFFAPKGIPTEAYGDRSIPARAIGLGAVGRNELSAEISAGLNNTWGPIGHYLSISYEGPPPDGYFDADGRRLLRSTYAELFSKIGTKYGGSGLYFNLPDRRGRTGISYASTTTEAGGALGGRITAATASNRSLGGTGGEETHTLTVGEMPSHSHGYTDRYDAYNKQDGTSIMDGIRFAKTSNTSSKGGDLPHNNVPPFIFERILIRAI